MLHACERQKRSRRPRDFHPRRVVRESLRPDHCSCQQHRAGAHRAACIRSTGTSGAAPLIPRHDGLRTCVLISDATRARTRGGLNPHFTSPQWGGSHLRVSEGAGEEFDPFTPTLSPHSGERTACLPTFAGMTRVGALTMLRSGRCHAIPLHRGPQGQGQGGPRGGRRRRCAHRRAQGEDRAA